MAGFLIFYKRISGEYQVIEFDGEDGHREALRERLRLESDARFADGDIEIAALSSDSLDSVRKTHSRYFNGEKAQFIEQNDNGDGR
ncbi:hypothetical protein [Nocardia sp. NPDC049149]|uniref:hypothetical protein n=1 Tax=Nocardia sp. NPDC049149 TaxID=3364315 RepID=UPI0037176502